MEEGPPVFRFQEEVTRVSHLELGFPKEQATKEEEEKISHGRKLEGGGGGLLPDENITWNGL